MRAIVDLFPDPDELIRVEESQSRPLQAVLHLGGMGRVHLTADQARLLYGKLSGWLKAQSILDPFPNHQE